MHAQSLYYEEWMKIEKNIKCLGAGTRFVYRSNDECSGR